MPAEDTSRAYNLAMHAHSRTALPASLLLAAAALLLAACETGEAERELTPAELPASVRDAVTALYPLGTIGEVEAETEDGQTVYEVELMDGTREVELKVAADGTVLETDTD